jgi:hypothetical protein
MKARIPAAVLSLASVALAAAPPAHAAPAPAPGTYAANVYVASAVPVPGGACPDSPGADYLGVVRFDGLGAGTLIAHFAFAGLPPFISRQVLTITNGAGTTRPSGTFTAQLSTGGGATGNFAAAFRLFDRSSFTAALTEVAPALGCTERFTIALVRIGP